MEFRVLKCVFTQSTKPKTVVVIESTYCNEYKMKFCPNLIFKAHFFPLKPYTNNLNKI